MSDRPPPDIDPDRLDFSEYHPLDHGIRNCDWYPGGRRRHLKLLWRFKWKEILIENILCRLGRHTPEMLWRQVDGKQTESTACFYCWKKMEDQ